MNETAIEVLTHGVNDLMLKSKHNCIYVIGSTIWYVHDLYACYELSLVSKW